MTTVSRPLLKPASAALLLAACAEADEGLGTFTRLALVAGARRAELLGVRWPDLHREEGSLLIACRDGGKTARARRTIALDQVTMNALGAWQATGRSAAEAKGIAFDEDGYVFGLELLRLPWPAEAVTRRITRIAAQTGVSATVADLRRYSMGRLSVLGVSLDVISHRLSLPARAGMIRLFASAESLVAADQEAARRLGRELDQALSVLSPVSSEATDAEDG
jgi:integrase